MANINQKDRRRQILDAARKCFETNGYAQTTMDSVAELAGIAKGSVYNYFQSKQDLFTQLFTDELTTSQADFDRTIMQLPTATEQLNGVLDNWFRQLGQHERFGRLILEFWVTAAREDEQGQFTSWFSRVYSTFIEKLTDIMQKGIDRGEFRKGFDPAVAATIILAVMDGIIVQTIIGVAHKSMDENFLNVLKRGILTGLTAEAPEKSEH